MAMHAERAPIINAMSVDVEDYFQVQALESVYDRDSWSQCQSRVERNTERLLELFEQAGVHATFFTLGWVAERYPALVRRIAEAGHELASHGYGHQRVDSQSPEAFREDIRRARGILQDASGVGVYGYRAPTFSVGDHTPWAWSTLEEEGYLYSSSVYPVKRDFYGMPDAPRTPFRPQGADRLVEIPISTVRLFGRNFPGGGGGYFRLLPYALTKAAIDQINRAEAKPAIFYLHPWEIDPDQPRPSGVPLKSKFRHYLNLSKTFDRLDRLSHAFAWDRVDRVFDIQKTGLEATPLAAHA